MINYTPATSRPPPVKIIAVILEQSDGTVVRFKLDKPTLLPARQLTISIIGGKAWLVEG